MKYNVSINEKSKTITVELNGYKGVAKCCDTDQFNITTGIELALERAKVAQKEAEAKKNPVTKSGDVMELIKALEKALPEGRMDIVGNGKGLTEKQKNYLLTLSGHKCKNKCRCSDSALDEAYEEGYSDGYAEGQADAEESEEGYDDGYDKGYNDGHDDGYDEGYTDAMDEMSEIASAEDLTERIREILADVLK